MIKKAILSCIFIQSIHLQFLPLYSILWQIFVILHNETAYNPSHFLSVSKFVSKFQKNLRHSKAWPVIYFSILVSRCLKFSKKMRQEFRNFFGIFHFASFASPTCKMQSGLVSATISSTALTALSAEIMRADFYDGNPLWPKGLTGLRRSVLNISTNHKFCDI